jgi:hypothetical protein
MKSNRFAIWRHSVIPYVVTIEILKKSGIEGSK